jgi:DNA anti-recombination protein RmuC
MDMAMMVANKNVNERENMSSEYGKAAEELRVAARRLEEQMNDLKREGKCTIDEMERLMGEANDESKRIFSELTENVAAFETDSADVQNTPLKKTVHAVEDE